MSDPRTDRPTDGEPDERDERDERDDEIGPLEGLLDPEEGTGSPAGDADAPAPPG